MTLEIYYLIGVVVSLYMIYFYLIKLKREPKSSHIFLAMIGPLVWPLQIIKHVYDLYKMRKR